MSLEVFTRLLDTYGADLSRWPQEHRDAAELLRRTSDEALRKWEAAEALEALFRQDRDRISQPARNAAIVNAALRRIRHASEKSFDWRQFFSGRWGAVAAATVLAGWLAGVVLGPVIQPSPERGISAVSILLGDETANIEDIL
jgi:hypothetical protein